MTKRGMSSRAVLALVCPLLVALTGCAGWSYRSIQLGHGPQDYDGVFSDEQMRRTDAGLCHISHKRDLTEAMVVQLAEDRRVAGKWSATRVDKQGWPRSQRSYVLKGEYSPSIAGLDQAGPLDILRDALEQVGRPDADPFVNEAHGWVAAGMFRIADRWHGFSPGVDPTPEATECLEQTEGTGVVRITIDPAGVYHIEYVEED